MSVELTTDAAAVDYYVQMSGNRDTYRGSFKGWVANEDHHMICVPVDWRARVLRRGLAVLGGMLTCWRRWNIDQLCRLNFDQGLRLPPQEVSCG